MISRRTEQGYLTNSFLDISNDSHCATKTICFISEPNKFIFPNIGWEKKKQVRNLCVYSRPSDRVWLPICSVVWFCSVIWLPIGWAKGPSSSLLPYSGNVKLTAAYRRWPWEKLINYQYWFFTISWYLDQHEIWFISVNLNSRL